MYGSLTGLTTVLDFHRFDSLRLMRILNCVTKSNFNYREVAMYENNIVRKLFRRQLRVGIWNSDFNEL